MLDFHGIPAGAMPVYVVVHGGLEGRHAVSFGGRGRILNEEHARALAASLRCAARLCNRVRCTLDHARIDALLKIASGLSDLEETLPKAARAWVEEQYEKIDNALRAMGLREAFCSRCGGFDEPSEWCTHCGGGGEWYDLDADPCPCCVGG